MSKRTYDLIMLLDADAPTDTRAKILADAERMIQDTGTVTAKADWGTRQTPFEIDHHQEAEFHAYQFEAEPETLVKLDGSLKIMDGLLRFRVIRAEPSELTSPPTFKREERPYERPPDNVAATDSIVEEIDVPVVQPAADAGAPVADASVAAADASAPVVDAGTPAEVVPAADAEAAPAPAAPAAEVAAEPETPAAEAPIAEDDASAAPAEAGSDSEAAPAADEPSETPAE